MTEPGVVDDGVMQQHQQNDERPRAVERHDAGGRHNGLVDIVRLP